MTEQHLHDPEVGAIVQQMRGECVPQSMRRQFAFDFRFLRVTLNDVPESLASHAVTASRGKQIISVAFQQDLDPRTGEKIS
jgi:hypothetical protein